MGINRPPRNEKINYPESEPHPEYPDKLKHTIRLIAALKGPLQKIPELEGSPIFDACTAIAKQFDINSPQVQAERLASENAQTVRRADLITFLPASQVKEIFPNIWKHFGKLISSNFESIAAKTVATSLKIMESAYIQGTLKPVHFFLHTLDKEGRMASANEEYSQNCITRLGGTHALELSSLPDQGYTESSQHVESLQIALAQSIVQYLLNQKDMAGQSPDTIEVPDKDYAERTRNTAKRILHHLQTKGWDGIANPELAKKLKDVIVWPNEKDENKQLFYATHDFNIQKNQNGKDMIVDPKITYDEATGIIDLTGLTTQLFSLDGGKIAQTNVPTALMTNYNDLYRGMVIGKSSKVKWDNYPVRLDNANLPQTHFALSFSMSTRLDLEENVLIHRANHGRIAKHLHLQIGDKKLDNLIQFTSHTPKDGQAARGDIDAIGRALGIKNPTQLKESIKVNPSYPNTLPVENPNQASLEKNMGLTDVEFGLNFNSRLIDENLQIINREMLAPTSAKIRSILRSPEASEAVRNIEGIEHSLTSIRNLHAEVIKILNPDLNRHTILGLIFEQDGSTANCVFPFQKYARLAFSMFPNIKKEIQGLLHSKKDDTRPNFSEIEKAIRLALTDQTLARLGLSPLGFLAIYASQSQEFAQRGAAALTPEAKNKTDVLFQISELGNGLASSFTSALSRFVNSISGGIGLINDRMTARVDLTNNNLLKRLNFDPGEIIPLLYSKKVPLNLQQQELLAKDFFAIQEVAVDLENWINFELHISSPSSKNTFAECVSLLKAPDNYMRYLQPHQVEYDKIDAYLQIIIQTVAYHHFSNRRDEFVQFTQLLSDHCLAQ